MCQSDYHCNQNHVLGLFYKEKYVSILVTEKRLYFLNFPGVCKRIDQYQLFSIEMCQFIAGTNIVPVHV